ncbi:MAG: NosD domain-containing protein [Candidatus Thermoplasmatota archaeon]
MRKAIAVWVCALVIASTVLVLTSPDSSGKGVAPSAPCAKLMTEQKEMPALPIPGLHGESMRDMWLPRDMNLDQDIDPFAAPNRLPFERINHALSPSADLPPVPELLSPAPPPRGNYIASAPFRINSNADFAAYANGGGDGSATNPWIIENYDINGTGFGYCIYIGNTTDYFVVRDCYLHEASGVDIWPYFIQSGLIIYNVQNGTITHNNHSSNVIYGIYLSSSCNNRVDNNTIINNRAGINLESSYNNTLCDNIADNNNCTIQMQSSSDNTVSNNQITSAKEYSDGIQLLSSSNYNLISNNTISLNSDEWGIYLGTSNHNNITNNSVSDSAVAIFLYSSINNTINHNNVHSNTYTGILLDSSSNNTIANNIANSNNWDGILLDSSSNNNLSNNTVSPNNHVGIYLYSSNDNSITDNTASSNTWGIYIYNSSNNTIAGNTASLNKENGIELDSSLGNTIVHNTAGSNTYTGLYLDANSDDNNILGNIVSSNGYHGVALHGSSNNTVANNTAESNNYQGIFIYEYSYGNLIISNTVFSNYYQGIRIRTFSDGNTIYHNHIIDNAMQAYDECDNAWDNGYPSGGNYWSDYTGTDAMNGVNQDIPGADGIGDTPYTNIQGGSGAKDNYPLMKPFGLVDTTPPTSSVNTIMPYWHNTSPITVDATAWDTGSAVSNVTLWYRFSTNNATWGARSRVDVDTIAPWTWAFDFPDGEGYYEFYTVANDSAGNMEDPPSSADAICAYDATSPAITDSSLGVGTTGDSYTFRAVVTDNLNLSEVHVVYWFGSGTETNATMARSTADNWEWGITIPSGSLDVLHYRIVAVDQAGNWNSTGVKDVIISDNDAPVADAGPDQTVNEDTVVTFDGSGSADNIGIVNYTWNFTFNGSEVLLYGVAPEFNFTIPGNYTVTLTVRDDAGNSDTDTLVVHVIPLPDTDGDGVPDVEDEDDDNDGYSDTVEAVEGTDPIDSSSRPADLDEDFIPDSTDPDMDGDGVLNKDDLFQLDPKESVDTDGDGIGNNADMDDDGDNIPDSEDPAPLNPAIPSDDYIWIGIVLFFLAVVELLLIAQWRKGD